MNHNYLAATNFAFGEQASPARFLSFPRAELVVIHKSVQNRHLGMKDETATLDVGRNKSARRQQGRMFPAIGAPETPVLRLTRGQAYLCPVGYSGLRRYTQVSVRRRHPGKDCRDPEAMDGNTNVGDKTCNAKLLGYERSHPCALVSGNPCRNDVLLKTCV